MNEAWTAYEHLQAKGKLGPAEHRIGALIAHERGNHLAARAAITRALLYPLDGTLRGEVRYTEAFLLLWGGDVLVAVDAWREWIDDVDLYPELISTHLGMAHYNRALALRQAKRIEEALAEYREAAEEFRAHFMLGQLCGCLLNLAWCACHYTDTVDSGAALAEAEPLCNTDELRWRLVVCRAFEAYVEKQHRLAMNTCLSVIDATDEVPAYVRSQACWLAGTVALETGNPDEAEALAQRAAHFGAQANGEARTLTDAAELLSEVRKVKRQRRVLQ